MLLSPNFSLLELTQSQTAARLGLDNTPNAEQLQALHALCENVLEPVRSLLGCAVLVSSGFRAPKVNARVGGATGSQHERGEAADVFFNDVTIEDAFQKIKASDIPFDQMIQEGTWLHISYKARGGNRRQTLRAKFKSGKASYSKA